MKILAIRGENIASLAQEFAVEFAQAPLQQHGLIAITGKTGAGKSSLLDAMCLALFEQVPRFSGKERSVEVGNDSEQYKLKANDVRHLVSRGRSEAYAEVDFLAVDGKPYRVKWQARRARNQLEGRWQQSSRELLCLDDMQLSSANKREFQQHIDGLVGLDFEQFRRAVVLPQGEFAAFLKAPEDHRSALLEKMTGTELYSQISQQVYNNAKHELQLLHSLQQSIGDLSLLDDSQRQDLDQQQSLQQQQLNQSERLLTQQASQSQYRKQAEQVSLTYKQQQQNWQRHLSQAPAQQQLTQQLNELDSVASLRTAYVQQQSLRHQLGRHVEQQQSIELQQQQTVQKLQQAEQALQDSELALTKHQQAQQAKQSQVDQAQRLDIQIEQALRPLQSLKEQQEQQTLQASALQSQVANQVQLKLKLQSQQQQLEQWLSQQQALAELPSLLPNLRQHLTQLLELEQLQQSNEHEQAEQSSMLMGLTAQINTLEQQLPVQQQRLSHLPEPELAVSEQQLQAAKNSYADLEQAVSVTQQHWQIANDYARWLEKQQQIQQQRQDLASAQQQLMPQLDTASQLQRRLAVQVEEAELSHNKAQAVMALDEHRQQLIAGEACPLCGSNEHPYQQQQPQVSSLLQQLSQRVSDLRSEMETNGSALSQLQMQLSLNQQQQVSLQSQLQDLEHPLAEQQKLAKQSDLILSEHYPSQLLQTQALADQLAYLQQQHSAQYQNQEQCQQQVNQQQGLQRQRHELAQTIQADTQQLSSLQQQQQQCQSNADSLKLHHSQQQQLLTNLEKNLQVQLVGFDWQTSLRQAGVEACWQACQTLAEQYQQQIQRQQELVERLHHLALQQQTSASEHVQLQQAQQQLQQQLHELQQQMSEYQQQRQSLLSGLSVSVWQHQQQQLLQCLDKNKGEALLSLNAWRDQQVQQQATLAHLQQEQANHQQQFDDNHHQWQQAIASLELSHEQAEALLSISSEQIKTWQQQQQTYLKQQQSLSQQAEQLQGQMLELDLQIEALQQQLNQGLHSLGLSSLSELGEYKQTLQEQLFQIRSRLDQDQQAKQQNQQLQQRLIAQTESYDLWEKLNGLIGSASGAKFRTFAQQLTLENLLAEANVQLHTIAPRYLLQRVPSAALALQVVDRDMGDEIRSLSSLSGGETFLISLALALALSGLASSKLQIGSLFIDEGFGSLDPESLDIALSCLDSLQATGRQVTVISHVQALVERIAAKISLYPLGAGRSELRVE